MKANQILSENKAWPFLDKLSNLLSGPGTRAYLVGGWVRDTLLGRDTADIDIAIAADAFEVASVIAGALGGTFVPLDSENRIARVVLPGKDGQANYQVDFSTYNSSIESDLARRDFTINAMAIRLGKADQQSDTILDPFGGQRDLQNRILRVVQQDAFTSDALRLLRAVRLAAELDFHIDKQTEGLIGQQPGLISNIAGERVREELMRILAVTGKWLDYMDELNLLTAVFPELAIAKGVEQPKEHHWNVFEHSLRSVSAVDFVLGQGEWEYADKSALSGVPWSDALAGHFGLEVSYGSTRRTLLKLAALLHDVSKPQTKALDANGRTRFLGHALEGAAAVVSILERLRFSVREIKLVETEVLHHLRPTQMSPSGLPTNRAIYRYFRDTGETGIDILFLSMADHLATRGPDLNVDGWQEHCRLTGYVLNKRFEQEKIVNPPKLIDGYDIINIFRMTPGRDVGELLEIVREAQASGEITTREEALSFVERLKKNAP